MTGRKSARKMKKKRQSQQLSEKSSVCHKWLRKRCTRDENTCLYYHSEFPCKFYYTGLKCKFRKQCMYRHGGPLSDHEKKVLVQHVETDPPDVVGQFRRYNYSSKQLWKMILQHEKTLMKNGSVAQEPQDCWDAKTGEGNKTPVENADGLASKLNYETEEQNRRGYENWEGRKGVEGFYVSGNKSAENGGSGGGGSDEMKSTNRSTSIPEAPKVKISICRNWVRPSKKGIKCERDESDCWYYHESFPCKFYHLGIQCRYGDRCRYTHGGPLSNHLKEVLALHISEDPDDIVGGFPRYSRETVIEKIQAHEAQMFLHDGSNGQVQEVEKKGTPITLFEQNIFDYSHKSSLPETVISGFSVTPARSEETNATDVPKTVNFYGEHVNNPVDIGMTAAEMEKILATLFTKPTNALCSNVTETPSDIWSSTSESQNSREQASVVAIDDNSNTVGKNYPEYGKTSDFSQLFSRRRPSSLSDEPFFSSKIRKIELNIMTSSSTRSPEGNVDGIGPLSEEAAADPQKQDVDLRPYLQPLKISEIYDPPKIFPEPKTDSSSVISAGVSSHCSSSWQVYKIDGLKEIAYEEVCFQKTFSEAVQDPRFRKYLRRYF